MRLTSALRELVVKSVETEVCEEFEMSKRVLDDAVEKIPEPDDILESCVARKLALQT